MDDGPAVIPGDVPETLAHGILAMLRAAVPCTAAAITVRTGRPDTHRLLANGGYAPETAGYLSVDFVREDPHYAMVRDLRDVTLFWADIPRFDRSVLAREVLRPVGYQEGTSVAVGPDNARGAAVLHVSFDRPDLDPRIAPVVAAYARRCSEIVADALMLEQWRLTPRELEVLRLVARGLPNGEIADRLYVTRRTVATHVEHILEKSGASTRAAVAARAAQLGLVRV
ncbi:helix-turn-helix transcriptional regulator [Pseudonocardia parietis]|uniref:DNA-binding CsgD family transcriptional regulator n=1 Tax=Pseudonocardia parietis TaxID=570936 RepID=A0ABS4VVZ1_9PSEU|nr:LuxR C-terminal-related transcriptional regulator [Pseudonocardia parietis]MBP2368105.1 DNA-binding CsgD family transcriptional regulator [Pseudonocardia parietis]